MTSAEENVPGSIPVLRPSAGGLVSPNDIGGFKTNSPADAAHKIVRRIACLGSGFVGGPTSAVTAFMSDVDVTVVDINSERVSAWNSDSLPIYEPGLDAIVSAARDGTISSATLQYTNRQAIKGRKRTPNLHFSTDIDKAVQESDLIFVCVNTPTKANGIGKGAAADLAFVEAAARNIAHVATEGKIIVEKSTVPCRTAHSIRDILSSNARPGVRFQVLSNPEFLAEGTAVRDLISPDRVIIGSETTPEGFQAARSLVEVYSQWIPTERIITMNLWSSELSKLAANALLAQRISSVNALSAICEATGADVKEVSHACGLDSRIGPYMLAAGPGFGGSCFQKDIFNIVYLAESLHLNEVADYWRGIITINEYQKQRFTKRVISRMFNNLAGKRIAVLGFAFKKNTSDTRESPTITLVSNFVAEKAQIAIYDPKVKEAQIWKELDDVGVSSPQLKKNVLVCTSGYEACHGADAVVIMTEWDEFSNRHPNITSNFKSSSSVSLTSTLVRTVDQSSSSMGEARIGGTTPASRHAGSQASSEVTETNNTVPDARKKENARPVIKDPTTGEVITFEKLSTFNAPKSSQTNRYPVGIYQEAINGVEEALRTKQLASAASTMRKTPLTAEPLPSALKDISQNLPKSPNRTSPTKQEPTTPPWSPAKGLQSTTRSSSLAFPTDNPTKEGTSKSSFGPEEAQSERLDWARIAKGMRKPMWVFDARNILDGPKLEAMGFRVEAIGRASKYSGFG